MTTTNPVSEEFTREVEAHGGMRAYADAGLGADSDPAEQQEAGDDVRSRMGPLPTPPLQPILWRVLVEPVPPKETSAGGILLPEDVQDAEGILTCVGRIVAQGGLAFQAETKAGLRLADEPNRPRVGWYVVFGQYAGQKVWSRGDREFRLLNDTEVLAVTDNPDEFRNYV